MAKLNVLQNVEGNITNVSTWVDNITGAKKAYHDRCGLLWGEKDVTNAVVILVDENMDTVDGCKEYIKKEATETERSSILPD